MQTRLKMSREGLELLKEFEGLRLAAAQLPDGRWTMGHGHTQYAREGATITASDAEALLIYDLIPVVAAVNDGVTPQISQNQFDALTCFAFNVGIEAFQQSEVLQRVNQERMTEAALAMAIWRSGAFEGRRVVLDALVRRRTAEEALLLGREAPTTVSDLIQPQIDPSAQASLPAEVVVDLTPSSMAPAPEATESAAAETVVTSFAPVEEGIPQPDSVAAPQEETVEAEIQPAVVVEAPVEIAASAEPSTLPEGEAVSAGAEPIVYTAPEPEPSRAVTSASLSARVFTTYMPEPMRPEYGTAAPSLAEASLAVAAATSEPVTSQSAEPPQVLVLTPPPEIASEPAPTLLIEEGLGVGEADQAGLFGAEVDASPDDDVIYYESEAEPEDRTARWSDVGAYVATGVVGLAAFGFGVAGFQLAGQDPVPAGMFDEKTAISWVLVGIGVVCVWIAAYNLFKRLGGSDELG